METKEDAAKTIDTFDSSTALQMNSVKYDDDLSFIFYYARFGTDKQKKELYSTLPSEQELDIWDEIALTNAEIVEYEEDYEEESVLSVTPIPLTAGKIRVENLTEKIQTTVLPLNVVVVLGEEKFSCNWSVLQVHSGIFAKRTYCTKIKLPHVGAFSTEDFRNLYKWMANEKEWLMTSELPGALQVVNYLKVPVLKNMIFAYLDDVSQIKEDVAFLFYLKVKKMRAFPDLEASLLRRIERGFLIVVASNAFLTLTFEELDQMLKISSPMVNDEGEVFYAIASWLNHDWEIRKEHMVLLLSNVRWTLMRSATLGLLTYHPEFMPFYNTREIERIVSQPDVKKEVDRAVHFNALFLDQKLSKEEIAERLHLQIPEKRTWVIDQGCSYHHDLYCFHNQNSMFKYDDFNDYLDDLAANAGKRLKEIKPTKNLKDAEGIGCSNPACCGARAWDPHDIRDF